MIEVIQNGALFMLKINGQQMLNSDMNKIKDLHHKLNLIFTNGSMMWDLIILEHYSNPRIELMSMYKGNYVSKCYIEI